MSRSLHPLLLWHRWSLSLQTMNSSHAASFEEDGECKQLQPRLLLPLPTTSPSSSGASSSAWQLVVPEGFKEGVPAFDIADVVVDAAPPLLASGSLPPRPSLRNFPKGSTWKAPTVCLRYSSPFQLGHKSPNFKPPVPRKPPVFGTPLLGPRPGPHQHSSFEYPGKPKPLPCFARAAEYSAFPKFSQARFITTHPQASTNSSRY